MPEYSLSLRDVKSYVTSKTPNQVVGHPRYVCHCLIANALKWKYPMVREVSADYTNTFAMIEDRSGTHTIDIPADVVAAANEFDKLGYRYDGVSRAELAKRFPELFS